MTDGYGVNDYLNALTPTSTHYFMTPFFTVRLTYETNTGQ